LVCRVLRRALLFCKYNFSPAKNRKIFGKIMISRFVYGFREPPAILPPENSKFTV
jgi:hypothetical protein